MEGAGSSHKDWPEVGRSGWSYARRQPGVYRDPECICVPRAAASVCTKCWNPMRPSGAVAGSPGPCISSHRRTGEPTATSAAPCWEGRVSLPQPNLWPSTSPQATGIAMESVRGSSHLRLRVSCQKVIAHKMFDHVVLVFIFLNCITIALERPDIDPGSTVSLRRQAGPLGGTG